MSGSFSVLSWNVQGEIDIGDRRLQRQLEFLDDHTEGIDCFLLQAVNSEEGSAGGWEGHLGSILDFFRDRKFHVVHTGDWARELFETSVQPHADIQGAHNRCNLTACRWPIERRPLTLRNRGDGKPRNLNYYYSHFPEKILVGRVDTADAAGIATGPLEVWNVGIINGANWGEEKLNMLETVYARIHLETTRSETPVVLGGDFNAPKRETAEGEIVPHGANKGQYRSYPYYGDPHYLRDETDEVAELRFDRRFQLAEARIFDAAIGSWNLTDAYWTAEASPMKSSTEDFTHIVSTAHPPEKRLDHVLSSEQVDVRRCELWNGKGGSIDGFDASDHAPVFAELSVS